MNTCEFFSLKHMGEMVGAGAGAEIFDKLEPELHKIDRLRNTGFTFCKFILTDHYRYCTNYWSYNYIGLEAEPQQFVGARAGSKFLTWLWLQVCHQFFI
jgi:hypothetical protein